MALRNAPENPHGLLMCTFSQPGGLMVVYLSRGTQNTIVPILGMPERYP